ncbi:hypothetical protein LTSEINV_3834 [Salmonella enterica subsp. enterica serovar Inverness str. R8-3668]|uniref:Uncharacterized protein n=1 Tax=Salmonella enterica subsp. enterica serovar Inverness str. R8-3668 TaxID=913075 RepID=G5NG71_SALET|nr:hypothetical protein LTSEINV_3834 [Salmonella enterica subsp. enterica serovar Inverness str. R8-3668]
MNQLDGIKQFTTVVADSGEQFTTVVADSR